MTLTTAIRTALLLLLSSALAAVVLTLPADAIIRALLCVCVPAVNLYPIVYAFRPWRSTPQGRALMTKALGNVILIDIWVLHAWLGDYPVRDEVRVIGFALFTAGVNYLFWTLWTSPGASKYPPRSWFRRR